MTDSQCPVRLLVWLVFGEPGTEVRCKMGSRHKGPHRASVWGLTSMVGGISTVEWENGKPYRGPTEALDLRLSWRSPPGPVGRPAGRPPDRRRGHH